MNNVLKKNKPVDQEKKEQKETHKVDKRAKSLKTISITSTILFIALLLIFNIVFDSILGETLKWDWTTGGQYSIGDVSKEILQNLDKDVQIVGLFDANTDTRFQQVRLMLEDYVSNSNGKLTVRYVDPDRTPGILKEIDPAGYLDPEAGEFVVYCPATEKGKRIGYYDIYDVGYDSNYNTVLKGIKAEQSMTGAIKYVTSETTPVVYFTTGHDELDYTENFTILESILDSNNYDVKQLDLFGLEKIPEDCAVLIMASPKKDITEAERRLIAGYLQQGGSLMFISDFNNVSFPELNKLLVDYNVEIGDTRLREGDTSHRFQDDAYILRAIAPSSKVTESEIDGFTLADNARGMNILKNVKEWIEVEPILTTSDQGYAETNGDPDQSSPAGTQYIALLSENKGYIDGTNVTQSAKVMLVGSSSIFSDNVLKTFGNQLYNAGLFYYSIQYLSNMSDSESLYIQSKQPVSYAVSKGSQSINVFTAFVVMILIPALFLIAALVVYRKRKHL
ncbi:MAG: GldG family protein [Clostridia bacterium]|nr:GldG family protein [Clostridia bacterium]